MELLERPAVAVRYGKGKGLPVTLTNAFMSGKRSSMSTTVTSSRSSSASLSSSALVVIVVTVFLAVARPTVQKFVGHLFGS